MGKEAKARRAKGGRGSQKIGDLTRQLEKDVSIKHRSPSSTSKSNALSTTGLTSLVNEGSSSHGTELSLIGSETKLSGGAINRPALVNQAAKKAENGDALASLMHIVNEWQAQDEPILSTNECEKAIQIIEEHLHPCDPKVAMVLLDETLELFKVPDNWNVIAKFYLEAIDEIPEDLLRETLKHVRMTKKWFPKPVELREYALDKLFHRRISIHRYKVMATKAQS